ncbi:MAG: lysylphosphatidylglycerol synthase domain-containing protein [Bacteroidetes bacterium]|nr:lysylphosphatidylglycerol synthase domain-containing protein [Bacteroidota bacterium]
MPKVHKYYNLAIRVAIAAVAYAFLIQRFFFGKHITWIFHSVKSLIDPGRFIAGVCLVLLLMLLNWGAEALKWKLLIRKVETVSFRKAFTAVMTGITVSFFTPNRVGEFLGRVFILGKADRLKGSLVTITGSLSQLLVTLVVGSLGGLIFLYEYSSLFVKLRFVFSLGIFIAWILFVLGLVFFYFNIRIICGWEKVYAVKGKWLNFMNGFSVLKELKFNDLLVVLGLSMSRYIIFTFQAVLLLKITGVPVPWIDSLIITSVIFLIMTAIPTIALAELGIRGSVAIFLFGFYYRNSDLIEGMDDLSIIMDFSLLWMINIGLPAVIGSFGLGRLRFFRNTEER